MTTQQLLDQLQTQLQKAPAFTHDIAGLYLRLSVEKPDERSSTTESQSIETQRDILIEHCQNLGIEIYDIYVDDGETGTNFKRSGFEQMIQDLEAGKINTVVCNDLSRFARNYKEAGYYIDNYFPEHNVRFIAKVDNVDRRYERMDIGIAIRNMMNEHYAHDVSRKTRAAKEIRAKSGKFIGSKPAYGYKRDPDDRHHLIVDEEAAGIVRWIFQMASTGAGYNRIARTLRENGVLNPESYTSLRFPEYYKKKKVVPSTKWHVTSVQVILQNPVYTGIMAQNRVGNITTKGKTVKKPVQDWIVVDNTHEALVDKETWSRVQEQIKIRRRATKDGKPQKYAGLLYCADCGAALSFSAVKRKTKPDGGQFKCWQYLRHGKEECSSHYITLDYLDTAILQEIRAQARFAFLYRDRFIQRLENEMQQQTDKRLGKSIKDAERLRKRISELDGIIKKLLEKNAAGIISDERFASMSQEYEADQIELTRQLNEMESVLQQDAEVRNNAEQFASIIEKYTNIEELNAEILNRLIHRIVVYDREYQENKEWMQRIDIYWNFIGLTHIRL